MSRCERAVTAGFMASLAVLGVIGGAPAAQAQRIAITTQQVFVTLPRRQIIDLATGTTESDQPTNGDGSTPTVFTADGRFAVWRHSPVSGLSPDVQIYDVQGRRLLTLPVDFAPLAVHPRALAVYGRTGTALVALDLGGFHLLHDCGPSGLLDLDVSFAGDRLAALCGTGTAVILDATTGAILRTLIAGPIPGVTTVNFLATNDRIVVTRVLSPQQSEVVVIDVASGQDLTVLDYPTPASIPAAAIGGCSLDLLSASRATGIVACHWFVRSLFPGVSFEVDEARRLDISSPSWGPALAVRYRALELSLDPAETTLIVTSHNLGLGAAIQMVDVATGASTFEAPLSGEGMAVAYAPLAPTGVSATRNGASVTLQWTLPPHSPMATGYVLEAGTAPGLANLATLALGAGTTFTIPNVPAGRYYLRVRAENVTGRGAPSNEVVLDVP